MLKSFFSVLAIGLFALPQAANAQLERPSESTSDRLSGFRTEVTIPFAHQLNGQNMYGRRMNLRVTATGNGINKLKVRVQYYHAGRKRWYRSLKMLVSVGTTSNGSYAIVPVTIDGIDANGFTTHPPMRMIVSRGLGTQAINFTIRKQPGAIIP